MSASKRSRNQDNNYTHTTFHHTHTQYTQHTHTQHHTQHSNYITQRRHNNSTNPHPNNMNADAGFMLKRTQPEALVYSKKASIKAKKALKKAATKTTMSLADLQGHSAHGKCLIIPTLTTEAAERALATLPRHAGARVESVRVAPTCTCKAATTTRAGKGAGKGVRVVCSCDRVTQYSCRGRSTLTRLQFGTPHEALDHLVAREGFVFVTTSSGEYVWEQPRRRWRRPQQQQQTQRQQARRSGDPQQDAQNTQDSRPTPITIPATLSVRTTDLVWTEEGEHLGQVRSRLSSRASVATASATSKPASAVASAMPMASTVTVDISVEEKSTTSTLRAEAPEWGLVRNKTSMCSVCAQAKTTAQFSGSQLLMKSSARTCTSCLQPRAFSLQHPSPAAAAAAATAA
jgi:hypothetical protein